jgi:hypothetical protein
MTVCNRKASAGSGLDKTPRILIGFMNANMSNAAYGVTDNMPSH